MIWRKFSGNTVASASRRRPTAALGPAALAMLMLVIAACAPVARRPVVVGDETVQALREVELARYSTWAFTGRLAIDQGGEGGNARVEWRQDGKDFDIRLSAPITRQSWRLRQVGDRITLEGLDGGIREGADPESLLMEATGWRIPLAAMAAWVRGVRAPGPADLSFDDFGLPATIRQEGWAVEYRGWSVLDPALPTKVFARRGSASVRLVIEKWESP